MEFSCDQCGHCCKFCNKIDELNAFDRGDGVCVFLQPDNSCAIYGIRPEVCNVKRMYNKLKTKGESREDYYKRTEEACKQLKMQYGSKESQKKEV